MLYMDEADAPGRSALEIVLYRLLHILNQGRKLRRTGSPSSPFAYLVRARSMTRRKP